MGAKTMLPICWIRQCQKGDWSEFPVLENAAGLALSGGCRIEEAKAAGLGWPGCRGRFEIDNPLTSSRGVSGRLGTSRGAARLHREETGLPEARGPRTESPSRAW